MIAGRAASIALRDVRDSCDCSLLPRALAWSVMANDYGHLRHNGISYFNQPDHELIDRTSEEAKKFLVDLARGTIPVASVPRPASTARDWPALFSQAGLPAADTNGVTLADATLSFAWRSHFVAAMEGEISPKVRATANAKG